MPNYTATVKTLLPPDRAFALMADFANAQFWDPATTASRQTAGETVSEGSRFELDMRILGRDNSIEYEIVDYVPHERVVLRGENSGSVSVDKITVTESGSGGAEVTYDAEVTMKGAYKLSAPLFAPVFKKMGDAAKLRMREWLDEQARFEH
jgi:uncharacterized protein YndB with AHSA1/START domain